MVPSNRRKAVTGKYKSRGKAAWDKIYEILVEVEAEWRTTLGDRQFEQLKKLLYKLWDSGLVQ